jgi:hypothetical protein
MVGPMNPTADTFRHAVVAAFEATMLVRCTAAGRPSSWSSSRAAGPEPIVEFSQGPAAQRLAELLREAGVPAQQEMYIAGTRHRYRVHRITTSTVAFRRLDEAWHSGYRELCGRREGGYLSQRQRWHCDRLAAAAWRAALLAAGRPKTPLLGVRVGDPDTAAVLIRASRFLAVPVVLRSRPGGPLLTMRDNDEIARMEEAAGLDEVLASQAA